MTRTARAQRLIDALQAAPAPPPPAELSRLVDAIGADLTLRLIEQYGGTRVFVSDPPAPDSVLWRCLGREAALALAAIHGRDSLRVPLAKRWRALTYRARGMTWREIARALGTTEKTVGYWLSGKPSKVEQADLFV